MGTIYEVVGDVMGDVMGDVLGDDGNYYEGGVGAAGPMQMPAMPGSWRHGTPAQQATQRRPASAQLAAPNGAAHPTHIRAPGGQLMQRVDIASRPSWRDGQAAPGVMLPDEGMVPLGMTPDNGTGTFAAPATKITWLGQLQKPYRAERLLVSVVRTGATAVGRLLGQFFVGVDLNMATIQGVDIESIGSPTAFGTRMTLLQAPPGVIISVPVTLSSALTAPDTIFASIMWTGRIIH